MLKSCRPSLGVFLYGSNLMFLKLKQRQNIFLHFTEPVNYSQSSKELAELGGKILNFVLCQNCPPKRTTTRWRAKAGRPLGRKAGWHLPVVRMGGQFWQLGPKIADRGVSVIERLLNGRCRSFLAT